MHLQESPGETLWAVVAGAILATVGGFIATQLESFVRRREREKSAALLFGEILSALETIISIARESHARGEPYGPFTLRLLRAARRETETYSDNRAVLYDIRNAEIRIRMHVLMVRATLALESVSDALIQISTERNTAEAPGDRDPDGASDRLNDFIKQREQAFQFVLAIEEDIKPIIAILRPIAKVNFGELRRFSGNPFTDSE